MNRSCWAFIFFATMNPTFNDDVPYFDLDLVSRTEYPALQKLHHLSNLEILILAKLIHDLEDISSWGTEVTSFSDFSEWFDNYDCTIHEINNALLKLHDLKLISIFINENSILSFKANKQEIIKKELYKANWDIYALGLENICQN